MPEIMIQQEFRTEIDPRLGRFIQFDERSRSFPVRSLLEQAPRTPRSYTWRCLDHFDQGWESSCVGFSFNHELIARPAEVKDLSPASATEIYNLAKTLDPWEGENYQGTSVLAGIKAVQKLHPGKIPEYRWAFGLEDVLLTLSYVGPIILGINWFRGMTNPDKNNIIQPIGPWDGGHAILAKGINVKKQLVRLHNSWGPLWGYGGDAYISFADLEKLLYQHGEACVPVKRAPETRRI